MIWFYRTENKTNLKTILDRSIWVSCNNADNKGGEGGDARQSLLQLCWSDFVDKSPPSNVYRSISSLDTPTIYHRIWV